MNRHSLPSNRFSLHAYSFIHLNFLTLFEKLDIIGRIFFFLNPSFWELLKLNERWWQVMVFHPLEVGQRQKYRWMKFVLDPHFWLIIER